MNARASSSPLCALYIGRVMHARFKPAKHRFFYRIFLLLIDLDELPALERRLKLFAYNKAAPISFYDCDHGPEDGSPLKPWITMQLREAGLEFPLGQVQLLTMPRIFGYVFNPLSIFYCHNKAGALRAVIYEVHNTFKQSHLYIAPVEQRAGDTIIRCEAEKKFYVSPFVGLGTRYAFRLSEPKDQLSLAIDESENGERLIKATLEANRQPLSDAALIRVLFTHPLLSLKVIIGIHFEAFQLLCKKVRFIRNPNLPNRRITRAQVIQAAPASGEVHDCSQPQPHYPGP